MWINFIFLWLNHKVRGGKGAKVSGECKEGLAASFGLVFYPPEGQLNKGTPNKMSELEPGLFTLGTHAFGSRKHVLNPYL
jgi:hypothetical protein